MKMKLPYFKLKDAFNETRDGFAGADNSAKLISTAKLIGKTFANAGMLAAEMGVEVVKQMPEIAGNAAKRALHANSDSMTPEQRAKAEDMIKKGNEARERRLDKEREARQDEIF